MPGEYETQAIRASERRRSQRFQTNRPIRFCEVQGEGRLRSGRVVNMSPTGLRIESPVLVTPGHAIEVEVEPTNGGDLVVLHGKVIRTESLEGSRYALGISSRFEVRGSVPRRLPKRPFIAEALPPAETAFKPAAPKRRVRFGRWLLILLLFFALGGLLNAANRSDVFATGNGGVFKAVAAAEPRLLESQLVQSGQSSRSVKKRAGDEIRYARGEAVSVQDNAELEPAIDEEVFQTAAAGVESANFVAEMNFDAAQAPRFSSEAIQFESIDPQLLIEIDLSRFMLYLRQNGAVVSSFPIGIGRDGATPQGRFQIARKMANPDWYNRGETVLAGSVNNPLGASWMGWGGDTRGLGIGIHPTAADESIEQPLSRGCVRLRPADAAKLFRLVPTGTPVWVHE